MARSDLKCRSEISKNRFYNLVDDGDPLLIALKKSFDFFAGMLKKRIALSS